MADEVTLFDRRVVIFPAYLDAGLTQEQGRKVAKALAVVQPTVVELRDSAAHLGFEAEVESKMYPKDLLRRGRVRVRLKNADGTFVKPEINTRMKLLRAVAELVPQHPLRQKRAQIAAAVAAKQQEKKASREAAAASGGGSSKKKGKKGRK